MGKKECWVHSALQSVRGCQGSSMEVMWPYTTCTLCCYIGSWRHEHFGMAFLSLKRGFDSHSRSFLPRDVVVGLFSHLHERPMGSHYIIREISRKLQEMLFVFMKENDAEAVWSYHIPLGSDWTIFEFSTRMEFCTSISIHHFLFGIHPACTCFRFRSCVDLTAAKLLGLTLYSFCLALSSVLSLQITLTRYCKSLFLCCSSCYWGLPSVSLTASPSLLP